MSQNVSIDPADVETLIKQIAIWDHGVKARILRRLIKAETWVPYCTVEAQLGNPNPNTLRVTLYNIRRLIERYGYTIECQTSYRLKRINDKAPGERQAA